MRRGWLVLKAFPEVVPDTPWRDCILAQGLEELSHVQNLPQRVAELQITLPDASADPAQQRPKEIIVGVDAQGRYVIDKNVFSFTTVAALADALKRSAGDAKEPVVVINADANATHQSVIHVMEAARQAGLIHITFATQTPTK